MTRGATDNDTTAHREHGEPADLRAITNCASSFRTIPSQLPRLLRRDRIVDVQLVHDDLALNRAARVAWVIPLSDFPGI